MGHYKSGSWGPDILRCQCWDFLGHCKSGSRGLVNAAVSVGMFLDFALVKLMVQM
jgi:hypothetical protein